jgi:predicted S18 family serine protease
MPALPLDEAGKYVAAAYLVFLALILVYVAIMAMRQARIQRDVEELARLLDEREARSVAAPAREEVGAR